MKSYTVLYNKAKCENGTKMSSFLSVTSAATKLSVVRMTIVSDATTWSVTYNRNLLH
jgi:hypothetical protein